VSFQIVHLSDIHFGGVADLRQLQAVEELVPDLDPRVIVLSGDLTQRARHGEFQAARAFVRELERTAPVFAVPGNHDVQWWWRPFIPIAPQVKYRKYVKYFGPVVTPTVKFPEAVITSALTSHGVAWGSLTYRLRDIAVKGHLPKKQIDRVKDLFSTTAESQIRVLVLHHNVLRGELSQRMGLARWKQASTRVVDAGADIVLCGHDHQELADVLGDHVVVSCAGTLSTRSRGKRPSVFNRVTVDDDRVHVELYRWEHEPAVFKRSDVHTFPRPRAMRESEVAAKAG